VPCGRSCRITTAAVDRTGQNRPCEFESVVSARPVTGRIYVMRPSFFARHIHLFGASGAGTSTLGRELARRHVLDFFDTDDFFWQASDPPYQKPNDRAVRLALLLDALRGSDRWVLAGSLCGWGDDVVPLLDLAVYVTTETSVRLQRLRDRESQRFGRRVLEGGDMYEQHKAFLDWAARYDDGPVDMRSRQLHENWLLRLHCRICRVNGARPIDELCDELAKGPAA
jgi:adenylate kinase family enzyme